MRFFLLSTLLQQAASSFSFGSAAAQDPIPSCAESLVQCNGEFCADTCLSLNIDPWLSRTIRFQYNLTRARSWRWGPIIGTHNAFISRANGFGLTEDLASALYSRTSTIESTHVRVPNQRYSVHSLLDLGVRELELDLWDTLVNNDAFEVVVCHSPVPDPYGVVALQQAADALGRGPLRYNPFAELCSNRTVQWAMQQVKDWLDVNTDDVVEIFLDNRVAPWNVDLIVDAITSVFNESVLTPPLLKTLFGGIFPSRDAMLANGLRVIIESNSYVGNNYTNTSLPQTVFWPTTWTDQPGPADLAPFPNCTLHGEASWYGSGLPRMLDSGDLAFDPESEGEKGIILKPVGLVDVVSCGVNNVGLADVTPAAMVGAVWSWAAGHPTVSSDGESFAAAMTQVRGSWTSSDVSILRPAVCRGGPVTRPAGNDPAAWRLTPAVTWRDAAQACATAFGSNFSFDLPRDGRENALIAQQLLLDGAWEQPNFQGVWLSSGPY